MAQEVARGMREAASRGFWVASHVPYGYRKVMVPDGAKKRPKLEPVEGEASLMQRMFRMAESGRSVLDIVKTLNAEGIPSPRGKRWSKTPVHGILRNETYTGALVWGVAAKDKAEPIRVENAFPAIVSRETYKKVAHLLESRAPAKVNPRRVASSYLLSGLLMCESCNRALTGQESKSGQFAYYVCNSLMKRGQGECDSPRLNARKFERQIIDQIRDNILTESNIRDLVKLLDEEMDGVAAEQRKRLETIEEEQVQVKRWLDRLYRAIETTDLEPADMAPRIREHREKLEKLQVAADEARAMLSERRVVLDDVETIASYARDMSDFLMTSDLMETKSFIRSFVREIGVRPGNAVIRYTIPMPYDSPIPGKDIEEVALGSHVLRSVRGGGPDWTKSRTEVPSRVTPSLGMGMVYVNSASSPFTSMPCTKFRISAFRSRMLPSFRTCRKSDTYPLISSVVGNSTRRRSSCSSAFSFAAFSWSCLDLKDRMRGDRASSVSCLVSRAS